jgi:hypothetical protein
MLTTKDLIEAAAKTPFPQNVKVRITIAGLAFCSLDVGTSKINFLRHVPSHELLMIVIKRVRNSGACYPVQIYNMNEITDIKLRLEGSNPHPGGIRGDGDYPLENTMNLHNTHGGPLEEFENPKIMPQPTLLSITHGSFYTKMIHPAVFKLVENLPAMPEKPVGYIGHVLGANISPSSNPAGKLIIENSALPGDKLELPGSIGTTDIVYDVIFNNHCTSKEECEKQVTNAGKKGTDFKFYYDVLKETSNEYRKFELVNVPNTESLLTIARGEPTDPPGGGEVAACNPVIIDPPW